MNIEYQFTGGRQDNVKMPGSETTPRIGETVLFIDDIGREDEYTVTHIVHIIEKDEISVQIVLR